MDLNTERIHIWRKWGELPLRSVETPVAARPFEATTREPQRSTIELKSRLSKILQGQIEKGD